MKRLIIFLFILVNSSLVFAQRNDSTVIKPGKTRNIEGAVINQSNNIVTNMSSSPNFSTFANAIKTAGLTDTFAGSGVITVFAPTNKAFEKLAPGQLDSLLLPVHNKELSKLLLYHAIAGRVTSKDIERQIIAAGGQTTLITLSGGVLTARINENRNIVLTDENGNQSMVSKFDILQSNGILDIVTTVLIPK